MSFSNRFFLYGPFIAVVLLGLGVSAYWYVVAKQIDAELTRLDGGDIVPGITLQFADKEINGFPFRFDVTLGGVTLSAQGPHGETAWRSERIALHAMAYGRGHYLLEADGLQTFSWPDAQTGAQTIIQSTSNVARASAIFQDGVLTRVDLDVINTEGEDASRDAAPNRAFSAVRAQLHLMAQGEDRIAIVMSADAVNIGTGFRPALGPELSRLRIEGNVTEAAMLDALRAGTADVNAALDAWRMAGGAIALDPIEAAWGGTLLLGESTLRLDDQRRLSGPITMRPEDPVSFLGALSQSEMIPADGRAQLSALREMAAGLGSNLDIPIRLEAELPLGDGPVVPQLTIEGMNGIVVRFASGGAAAAPLPSPP